MIINSRSSNFIFNFPKDFVHESISDKYLPFVKRMPIPWDTVLDFLNAQVQSISMPSLSMSPVSQTRKLGKSQVYKSGQVVPDLFSKDMTVTMRTLDGYINYWIFLENALRWLDFTTDELYFNDLFINITNQEGYIVQKVRFEKVLLTSVSEISLSFSDNNPDFKTFDCTFTYNAIDISVPHD